tara:strand:+ start:337 stop:585 length:249 start_codon:yes stop_codon:yes gene_type:complete
MKEIEVDFTEQIKQLQAEKEAGYPPNCNEGYEVRDGKCVKIEEDNAKKKENPFKKKGDKKGDKKGEEKEGGKNLPPWLKKKK